MNSNDLSRHDLSAVFGDIPEDEYNALLTDIKENGINDPNIITCEGLILDGWHRYKIAKTLEIIDQLIFTELPENEPLDKYVLSQNLHRRHLTPSQRAQISVEINEWVETGTNRYTIEDSQNEEARKTNKQLAEEAGVSERAISDAKKVKKETGRSDEVIKGEKSASAVLKEEKDKVESTDEQAKQKEQVKLDEEAAKQGVSVDVDRKKYSIVYANLRWDSETVDLLSLKPSYEPLYMKADMDKSIAKNAVLYLWAPAWKIPEAISVMEQWGFDYRTNIIWINKGNYIIDNFLKQDHEMLLLGTKGNGIPIEPEAPVPSVIDLEVERVDAKPEAVVDMLKHLYKDKNMLYLTVVSNESEITLQGDAIE